MSQKKILIIAFSFPPIALVGSFRPYRFFKYLPNNGWIPTVITTKKIKNWRTDDSLLKDFNAKERVFRAMLFDPMNWYNTKKILKETRNRGSGNSVSYNKENNKYRRNKNGKTSIMSLVKKMLSNLVSTPDHQVFWNFSVIWLAFKILNKEKFDIILTTSPPHSIHISGLLLSKLFRIPWVADFRDPWTQNFMYKAYRTPAQMKISYVLEKLVVKNATRIISTTNNYTQEFQVAYPIENNKKFCTITNSFEKDKIDSIEAEPFRKFTVCLLGVLYHHLKPYEFFDALAKWKSQQTNLKETFQFMIVYDNDPFLEKKISEYGIEDITTITGYMPHDNALSLAKSSDMLLLSLGTGDKTPRGWIPAKLFDYLGCRKPILGIIPNGIAAQIIRETESGFVIEDGDSERIISVLKLFYEEKNKGTERSIDNKKILEYETSQTVSKLSKILDKII